MIGMSGPAVLLIGASGFIGTAVSQAFLEQKSKFKKVATLVAPGKGRQVQRTGSARDGGRDRVFIRQLVLPG